MIAKNQEFHNKIAQLCLEKYNSLAKTGKPKENEWTVLSAIVVEESNRFEVIALGTGSKCIGHDKLSKNGDILNDSHAEIMCRRVFLRYIYENLISQNNMFQYDPQTQTFNNTNDSKFHFFTSHVPCGDAAIFPKESPEDVGNTLMDNIKKTLKRKKSDSPNDDMKRVKHDVFRTGAKCLKSDTNQDLQLPGANYHITGVVRTKPGRGCLTLSVSCSDKLAKWCHLGVQGALLSILLSKPIYLSSFTIAGGTPFCEEALKRALFKRLGNVVLEISYCRHELFVGQSDLVFSSGKSEGKNPCPSSIAWFKTKKSASEVAVDGHRQGITKKQIKSKGALKISKRELMKNFIQVVKKYQINLDYAKDFNLLTYKEAKQCAQKYQKSWDVLKKCFNTWTVKNDDLLDFTLSEVSNK